MENNLLNQKRDSKQFEISLTEGFFTSELSLFNSGLQDYCPWESFKAKCQKNEVIVMEVARYGRMRLGRCVKNDLGYVGCFSDVIQILDSKCSGIEICHFYHFLTKWSGVSCVFNYLGKYVPWSHETSILFSEVVCNVDNNSYKRYILLSDLRNNNGGTFLYVFALFTSVAPYCWLPIEKNPAVPHPNLLE